MALTSEELQIFLEEISRYAQQHIVPATTPYEHPMDTQTMVRFLGEIESMGIIPQIEGEAIGLWADTDDSSTTQLSLGLLRTLGRANTALAVATHRQSLSNWLLRESGLPASGDETALIVTGHFGLARGSLGRWLQGSVSLTDEDTALLEDWLNRSNHESVACSLPDVRQVLWPIWRTGAVQWQLVAIDQLDPVVQVAHGLDELEVRTLRARTQAVGVHTDMPTEQARKLYANMLKMEFLGLTAIGLGVLDRSSELAVEFSGIRSQGGKPIREHPAVQIMLSEVRTTVRQVEQRLHGLQSSVEEIALEDAASIRMTSCEALVHACHQVIQIHGGIGYMRDAGPEKYVRDQNMLRLSSGAVLDLPLFIHGVAQ